MLHACAAIFDVSVNLEKTLAFGGNKAWMTLFITENCAIRGRKDQTNHNKHSSLTAIHVKWRIIRNLGFSQPIIWGDNVNSTTHELEIPESLTIFASFKGKGGLINREPSLSQPINRGNSWGKPLPRAQIGTFKKPGPWLTHFFGQQWRTQKWMKRGAK